MPADHTYYDLPKPRTSFPVGHLTTGIAYAFPWHRDVWYSAPAQQINWWLPIFAVGPDNSMSFDVPSFDRVVPNSSDGFDYYENNAARLTTASQLTRRASVPARRYRTRSLRRAGGSAFAGGDPALQRSPAAPVHSEHLWTVPLQRRLPHRRSDGPRVRASDAPLLDVHCTGTAIRDFRNVGDDRELDEDAVRALFGTPPPGSMLVFSPTPSGRS